MARILSIDLETYSEADISKTGAYRYTNDDSFEIMLFAYAWDDEPAQIVDFMHGEEIPLLVLQALQSYNTTKMAFNANFEINSLSSYGYSIKPEQWECTMVKALNLSLPGSLEKVGEVLKLGEDKAKMKIGKELIKYFCKPCKPTKANGMRTRNLPEHDPEKWELFKQYCIRDVETEREIRKRLDKFEISKKEHDLWVLDQKINSRGLNIDKTLVEGAIKCSDLVVEKLTAEAKELTGLDNPNSPAQLKKWLGDKLGREVTSLTKDDLAGLIEEANGDKDIVRLIEIRQQLGKSSVKKYQAMINALNSDGRVRGLLQFYGASRTGRWAGRLVQVQNLPQNHLNDLEDAREYVKDIDIDMLELLYDSVPDTLSQLIRTAFIPSEGNQFMVADFSAIEARVVAWLANEKWVLDVFRGDGKIYEATAANMFGVPIEGVTKENGLRQKGKVAQLACGYGGSKGALAAMDKSHSIPEDEYPILVNKWRKANPHIVQFWWDVDRCAKEAIENRTTVALHHGIKFIYDSGFLFIQLPSGRRLAYAKPCIEEGNYGKDVIAYMGMEQTKNQWTKLQTYGPKLVENIVQAVARDCLAETMLRVEEKGYPIVMHVHDEIIVDVPKNYGSLKELNNIFAEPIDWADGLPLCADGYTCEFYKKD